VTTTARDWLAHRYDALDQLATTLNDLYGPLVVPAGTRVFGADHGLLRIRRGHCTVHLGPTGFIESWGYSRADRGPTLAALKVKRTATAQQFVDALTAYTDPACQCPTYACRNTADHSVIIDGTELFLCADHCPDCNGEAA